MPNFKHLWLVFALIALKVYCDPVWVNQSFSILPILLITSEILPTPPITTVVELYPGPENGTNLFAMGTKISKNETNDISILNTTSLSSIREFFDIGSLYPFETVAIVSLPGYVFYTAVVKDHDGLSQILGFPMLPGAYFPDEFTITNSKDKDVSFKVLQLLANGPNSVMIYTENNLTNKSLYLATILIQQKTVGSSVLIDTGNITNVTCDTDFNSTSAVCIYKIDDAIFRTYIPLNDSDASPKIHTLATDNLTSSENITYLPQTVIATNGYYTLFTARLRANHTELIAQVFDASYSTFSNTTSNSTYSRTISRNNSDITSDTKPLKTLDTLDSSPLQGALPYGDRFVTFYRSLDESKNQTWFYTIYNKDLTAIGSEVKLADVSGADSGFKVAKEFGTGAVNIAAYTYTNWHGAIVLNLYYGQILNKTSF